MANRKYCEDCQEDNEKVIGDSIVWIFPVDSGYTDEELNFIVNECSTREKREQFNMKKRLVCESCRDKYC